MRIVLTKCSRKKLFLALPASAWGAEWLANKLGISSRSIRDWKRGAYTIPKRVFRRLVRLAHLQLEDLSFAEKPDTWHILRAARKGGLARTASSNPGTPEGRRLGGQHSLETHYRYNTGFTKLKQIRTPKHSEDLAELLGILFGDGHLSQYQIQVTTSAVTDLEHANYCAELFKRICGITATLKKRHRQNVVTVTASSRQLVSNLNRLGMPIGNKIMGGLAVPTWIKGVPSYRRSFLRGLFDTDGCIYLDTHRVGGKRYRHLGWTITSYADILVKDIIEMLASFGFHPTHRSSQRSVFMRRRHEVERYFKYIGTNNPKHAKRHQKFLKQAN